MDLDDVEDYLELNDQRASREIEMSNEDIRAGRTRPAASYWLNFARRTPNNRDF